jgi:hypothetical protein
MNAIQSKLDNMMRDLTDLGVTASLLDQLGALERELASARKIDSAYTSEEGDVISAKREGYLLALEILERAQILDKAQIFRS